MIFYVIMSATVWMADAMKYFMQYFTPTHQAPGPNYVMIKRSLCHGGRFGKEIA